MPEESEVDLDTLRETIDEEVERGPGRLLRWISLSTAILAALAAVASLRAGATVNEALLLKTDATQLQAQASDAWAFYQAKSIKAGVAHADADVWAAAGRSVPPLIARSVVAYETQEDSIRGVAVARERARDERNRAADVLLGQHEHLAYAVAFFQIAIALGAVAALTRGRAVWFASLALGLAGLVSLAIHARG